MHQQLAEVVARTGSQQSIADALGIKQPQLNYWLTGRRAIPIERAEQIARACGCELRIRVVEAK